LGPTGSYCCMIPVSEDIMETVCINFSKLSKSW